ncbi:hypothetical protein CANARDRAFT_27818 [[Candida] arabinofermentans NRRL YB-2248]|uniref:Uncharacterized protein n=1 Tax=[Candida] arabinofermentans NRRL YB-2248 TaxID=983967 RepID=A0A1E4T1T9_9ASCO|nr:hypothetical protein CANARDRAFT_27818 [[Candida] arabinofermentans NRRL YB-2248]
MQAITQISKLSVNATATSLAPLAILSKRGFSSTIPKLFEKESESKAQALAASQTQPAAQPGSFKTFAQYRLLVVQSDPLSMQTKRTFSSPVIAKSSENDAKLRDLAKKIAYKEN